MVDKKNKSKKYISHNINTGEVHIDRYNIEFMRFFTLQNFILAVVGSLVGTLLFVSVPALLKASLLIYLNTLYFLLFVGGASFFVLTSLVVYYAGNSKVASMRLAGRRGLFTFAIMMVVVLLTLAITGNIYWEQQFYYFLKYFMLAMIFAAIFAVPMDYGVSFVKGRIKEKRYKSI